MQEQVLAHKRVNSHLHYSFSTKGLFPLRVLKLRKERRRSVQHCHRHRPCSSAPASETTNTDFKVCFPAGPVQSLPSPVRTSPQQLHCILGCCHLWGVSLGHPSPCTAPVTVTSATDKGQYLQSPGCNEAILKGHYIQHQNLTELFCWVINVTALLQTWVCFVILPPHSKWICWVLLRKRKKVVTNSQAFWFRH